MKSSGSNDSFDIVERIRIHLSLGNLAYAEQLLGQDVLDAELTETLDWELNEEKNKRENGSDPPSIMVPVVLHDGVSRVAAVTPLTLSVFCLQSFRPSTFEQHMDDEVKQAMQVSCQAAWDLLRAQNDSLSSIAPHLYPVAPGPWLLDVPLSGNSLGLAVLLAAWSCYTGMNPLRQVVATGSVAGNGRLIRSAELDLKRKAWQREGLQAEGYLFLEPNESISDSKSAIVRIFGESALAAKPFSFYLRSSFVLEKIDRLIENKLFTEALERIQLEVDRAEPVGADYLRLLWRKARVSVHQGEEDAIDQYDSLLLLAEKIDPREWDQNERILMTIERAVCLADRFQFEAARNNLQQTLEQPNLQYELEIHAAGTLAMIEAMSGRPEHAIQYRLSNIKIHFIPGRRDYRETLARTRCTLAWECFLAGDKEAAKTNLVQAEQMALQDGGTPVQAEYNRYCRLRLQLWGILDIDQSDLDAYISNRQVPNKYPMCMTRMVEGALLSQGGRHPEAVRILSSIRLSACEDGKGKGLIPWLKHLGLGWEVHSLSAMGNTAEAKKLGHLIHEVLSHQSENCLMPEASRWYGDHIQQLEGDTGQLAHCLRVWYSASWY